MFGSAFYNETLAGPGRNCPDSGGPEPGRSWQEAPDVQGAGGAAIIRAEDRCVQLEVGSEQVGATELRLLGAWEVGSGTRGAEKLCWKCRTGLSLLRGSLGQEQDGAWPCNFPG